MNRHSARRRALSFLAFLTVLVCESVQAGVRVNAARSFYLPVRFVVCPGLESIKLWVVGQEKMVFGPGQRIFQFTYFPEKKKLFPEHIEVRMHADQVCDGEDLDANVIITLSGIFSSIDSAEFSMERFRKQLMTRKRDIHFPPRIVRIQCRSGLCDEPVPATPSEDKELSDAVPEGHGCPWAIR